jgi:hypothetical protein
MILLVQLRRASRYAGYLSQADEPVKAVGNADDDLMDVDKKDAEEVEQGRANVQAS